MRTIIYVDGFNLYYRCLKNTPYKWLNLHELFFQLLHKNNEIIQIKYFTARVSGNPRDRQKAYIKALQYSIPNIEIYYGHFLKHLKDMPLSTPPHNKVNVINTEEKGSDVNLSAQLLNDAWLDNYDCAVVVSNDSDMAESMRLVRKHHPKKIIGLITPGENIRTSDQLKKHANFVKKIRNSYLENCQLPNTAISKDNKRISKPASW